MSATISGDTISLTRGDSLILTVSLEKDGEAYIPQDGDKIRFAMKKDISDKDCLILKDIDMNTMRLQIDPEDTKNLSFGSYIYDIELTTSDGFVDTFIGPATFKITKEVY